MTEKKAAEKKAAEKKAGTKKPAAKKAAPKAAGAAGKKAPAKAALPKAGDKVAWGTSQGETHGTVEKVVTSPVTVKGFKGKATKEKPEVLVKSDKSGKEAVHKPEELKKR